MDLKEIGANTRYWIDPTRDRDERSTEKKNTTIEWNDGGKIDNKNK